MPNAQLAQKQHAVETALRRLGNVIVAFSGGVDSTLLAKLSRDVLGKGQALAVTADSPSLSRDDLAQTRRLALELDLEHLVIQTQELDNGAYRQNTAARCYICKGTLFQELEVLADSRGAGGVIYGAISDDLREVRPGQRAASERGVHAPLQAAGFEKWDVRELARLLGISNWNRPQNACLSSRIPRGLEVNLMKLSQVEEAERFLRAQGFAQVRVRHLGSRARIEVGADEVGRFGDPQLCSRITGRFHALGFGEVVVDRRGYRAGRADQSPGDDELSVLPPAPVIVRMPNVER